MYGTSAPGGPLRFFLLTFAFSVPFRTLGLLVETPDGVPTGVPVSALMLVCPITAAVLLT
ncbi:hypothetical protein NI17_006195 [Thermobifida halotolerans]|uniref:Uncharacterized protein n=1 Tax=Thermobifida halotolerans TaxID=483545 RepID=A0A399G7H3_9ACTN|nr:hypothetical protein [Thermobifida halotolerans]UOE20780.1 hypothetical protein NI17_006195 [Thermobifida halotolerans]